MRLSRNRNWGQPSTIAFLEDLSRFAATQPGWDGLYVGDIAQPRGGPAASGHVSHQTGLDAAIWLLPPKSVTLSAASREKISANSILAPDRVHLNSNWTPEVAAVLKHAAQDPRIDRIFITAPAKIALCATAKPSDTPWLQKIRPYWGHDDHMHVRLKCPAGATTCQTQTPGVAELSKGGNGCDSTLTWWVTDALHPPKTAEPAKPAPKVRGPRDYVLADLPAACQAVLSQP